VKNLKIVIAFLIAPLAAPILGCVTITLLSLDDLSGLFMVLWIVFVLLTPFSYVATFFFGILSATFLKEIVLRNKKAFLLSGTGFGLITMFILCFLTPFFTRNFLFVLGGAGMGFAVAYIFSFIAGVPKERNTKIVFLQDTKL